MAYKMSVLHAALSLAIPAHPITVGATHVLDVLFWIIRVIGQKHSLEAAPGTGHHPIQNLITVPGR